VTDRGCVENVLIVSRKAGLLFRPFKLSLNAKFPAYLLLSKPSVVILFFMDHFAFGDIRILGSPARA